MYRPYPLFPEQVQSHQGSVGSLVTSVTGVVNDRGLDQDGSKWPQPHYQSIWFRQREMK
jgi:hypothetical protein